MNNFRKISLFVFVLIALSVLVGRVALAVNAPPTPLVDVQFPCPSGLGIGPCPTNPTSSIPGYLNSLYIFSISIAGLLALGMIVAGGVYYTVSSGSGDKQREAKSMITSALLGATLLFASYLILNTINPEITSLSLNFTNIGGGQVQKITTSTSAATEAKSTPQCSSFSSIHLNPPLANTAIPATCNFRKNYLNADTQIAGGDNSFYDPGFLSKFFGTTIKKGSVIWVYPYYVKTNDPSTAQCLIYAYREPNSDTVLTGLNENLNMCPPQQQLLSAQCSAWNFTALSASSPSGPWVFAESGAIPVNDSFNYTDSSTPPPTTGSQTKICGPSSYCKDRAWYCVQYK